MTPATYNFTLYQGSTWTRTFTWMQSDGVTPVDLTGCTAKMQGRLKGHTAPASAGNPLFELDSEDGEIVMGDDLGTVTPTISDELSSSLSFKQCEWDLEIYFLDGTTQRLVQGTILMNYEVTKDVAP